MNKNITLATELIATSDETFDLNIQDNYLVLTKELLNEFNEVSCLVFDSGLEASTTIEFIRNNSVVHSVTKTISGWFTGFLKEIVVDEYKNLDGDAEKIRVHTTINRVWRELGEDHKIYSSIKKDDDGIPKLEEKQDRILNRFAESNAKYYAGAFVEWSLMDSNKGVLHSDKYTSSVFDNLAEQFKEEVSDAYDFYSKDGELNVRITSTFVK